MSKDRELLQSVCNEMQANINVMQLNLDNLRKSLEPKHETFTFTQVSQAVCKVFEVTKGDLTGPDRKGVKAEAKMTFAYLLFRHVSKNPQQVAKWMGRKSRTGIIRRITTAESLIDSKDKLFCGNLDRVMAELKK